MRMIEQRFEKRTIQKVFAFLLRRSKCCARAGIPGPGPGAGGPGPLVTIAAVVTAVFISPPLRPLLLSLG